MRSTMKSKTVPTDSGDLETEDDYFSRLCDVNIAHAEAVEKRRMERNERLWTSVCGLPRIFATAVTGLFMPQPPRRASPHEQAVIIDRLERPSREL